MSMKRSNRLLSRSAGQSLTGLASVGIRFMCCVLGYMLRYKVHKSYIICLIWLSDGSSYTLCTISFTSNTWSHNTGGDFKSRRLSTSDIVLGIPSCGASIGTC